MPSKPIITADWYADNVPVDAATPVQLLSERFGSRAAEWILDHRFPRGLALGTIARRSGNLVTIKNAPGSLVALAIAALPPRRRGVVVLEFIRRPDPPSRWRRTLYRAWWRLVERPAIRRGMSIGQVLTESERRRYLNEYGLEAGRLALVRWPLSRTGLRTATAAPPDGSVFASGRTACDWETLFAAATGSDWPLTVVCSRRDLPRVEGLNRDGRAQVFSELSREQHERLLASATIYALVLIETHSSSGHVRLMTAVEHGVPVVATAVEALDDYVRDGETARTVPPGDPQALARAIAEMLDDAALRERLREGAYARASAWPQDRYFEAISGLVPRASRV